MLTIVFNSIVSSVKFDSVGFVFWMLAGVSIGCPNKSICPFFFMDVSGRGGGAIFLITISSPVTLFANCLNSSSVNNARILSLSASSLINDFSSNSTGASSKMVANFLESKPCSAKLITFSFCFPLSSSE